MAELVPSIACTRAPTQKQTIFSPPSVCREYPRRALLQPISYQICYHPGAQTPDARRRGLSRRWEVHASSVGEYKALLDRWLLSIIHVLSSCLDGSRGEPPSPPSTRFRPDRVVCDNGRMCLREAVNCCSVCEDVPTTDTRPCGWGSSGPIQPFWLAGWPDVMGVRTSLPRARVSACLHEE